MDAFSEHIEKIILQFDTRGMEGIARCIPGGYCRRAARLIMDHRGPVLIGTGFPVRESFETDGPIGAVALYRVLQHLGSDPIFVCGPPLSRILGDCFQTYEIPIKAWDDSILIARQALEKLSPALLLAVEPSVTVCDELVIATVSNWGVYGVIAELSRMIAEDLFTLFAPAAILSYLMSNGGLDGVTTAATPTEDGFPMAVGDQIITQLKGALWPETDEAVAPARKEIV